MKKFVVERILHGAGMLTSQELQAIAQSSCDVISRLGKSYHWIESFVTDDKIYCIIITESEEMVREHARLAKFPINTVSEVRAVIDPLTSNPLYQYVPLAY